MEKTKFSKILLNTAFSCMACDGNIDKREVNLIKALEKNENLFGVENIEDTLNNLINNINEKGIDFLNEYIYQLKQLDLTENEEIQIIKTAIKTIEADEQIEYSEIKFFKIIRSELHVSNESILQVLPHISEYLEQDIIGENFTARLIAEYFNEQSLPQFKNIHLDSGDEY